MKTDYRVKVLSLILLANFSFGCQIANDHTTIDLGSAPGKVERIITSSFKDTLLATLSVLDETKVRPRGLMVRDTTGAACNVDEMALVTINSAVFKPIASIFLTHKLPGPDDSTIPFVPLLLTYKGETEDGKVVMIVIRDISTDRPQCQMTVRVGLVGNESWGTAFVKKVQETLAPQ